MSTARRGSIERRRGAYRLLEAAGPYALLQRSLGAQRAHQALSEHFLDPFEGMRVLDVGAGTGALRPLLGECTYTALEPNPEYVATMSREMSQDGATIVQGTSRDMELLDGPFDRVLMIALLHHLDDATANTAFADAARLLVPGGRIVTLDPCFHEGQSAVARRLALMDRGANVRGVGEYGRLATSSFSSVRTFLSTDLLRVPYSHAWVVATRPASAVER